MLSYENNNTLTKKTTYSEAVSLLIISEFDNSIPQAIVAVECVTLQYFFVANKSNERVLCCAPLWWAQNMASDYPLLKDRRSKFFFKSKDKKKTFLFFRSVQIILVIHFPKPILIWKRFVTSEALNLKSINQWFLMLHYNRDDLSAKHYRLSINSKNSTVFAIQYAIKYTRLYQWNWTHHC